MPTTEKTWRNQKLLHVVFAFSSLAMLLATLWMVRQDHDREWKRVQRKYRDIEQRLTGWQIDNEAARRESGQRNRLESALLAAQSQAPSEEAYVGFKEEVQRDAVARQVEPYDFTSLDQSYSELVKLGDQSRNRRKAAADLLEGVEQARQAVDLVMESLSAKSPGSDEEAQVAEGAYDKARVRYETADRAAVEAESVAASEQSRFLGRLDSMVKAAKFRETEQTRQQRFRAADRDAAMAALDRMMRDNRPTDELERQQALVDVITRGEVEGQQSLDQLTRGRDAAMEHRKRLQSFYRRMTARTTAIEKQIADEDSRLEQLEASFRDQKSTYFTWSPPFLGKKWLELPLLDAFNSPRTIDNLWTEGLTQPNGSFGEVTRFDRCTTCHRAIDKTRPGSVIDPYFVPGHRLQLVLETPPNPPKGEIDDLGERRPLSLEQVYGLRVADQGLIHPHDVTVKQVVPRSAAANARVAEGARGGSSVSAGLQVGDVLLYINQDEVTSVEKARQLLIDSVSWGQRITLTIDRGLPQPYSSHPRLDLFVGPVSPHKVSRIGCTVCHEGQGSATDFKYASHTPNDPDSGRAWARQYGWFNNCDWPYPMYPRRFAESLCLKCHHEVDELESSDRFPDPPAPQLIRGYHLVEELGCFGCHEINGYDGPDRRIGPDMRLEPDYSPAAATIEADPGFSKLDADRQASIRQLIEQPMEKVPRHRLRDFLLRDATAAQPLLHRRSHEMAAVLQDVEVPGRRRKVGTSLRYVSSKLGEPFLYDWIRDPKSFRPYTRMPHVFGQWNQLDGADLELARHFEPLEILGIVKYLTSRGESLTYLERAEVTESPSVDRGKVLFETRGCLACHQHQDFPAATSTFGPDLSNEGDKLSAKVGSRHGADWLYTWIKQPTRYHARTKMPDSYLLPLAAGEDKTTDPAADIVAYLMESKSGWQLPQESVERLKPNKQQLDNLVLGLLRKSFIEKRAIEYLRSGIPERLRPQLEGAEVELVGAATAERKLRYVGRKAIGQYGCFACHDIPGFEAARQIGPALSDWGRKDTSQLAFEHILEYVDGDVDGGGHVKRADGETRHVESSREVRLEEGDASHAVGNQPDRVADRSGADSSFDESFYRHELGQASRIGFVWQKLKEPRSYDYRKTANKRYDERLRMPRFSLSAQEREAIVTFVLGLVADPPAEAFVYHPDPRTASLVAGRQVLNQFNCAGCHLLEPERWVIEFHPGDFDEPPEIVDFPFMDHFESPEALAASAVPDPRRGVLKAVLVGTPSIDNASGLPIVLDEEGDPVEAGYEYDSATFQYPFDLWQAALIDGRVHDVGVLPVIVPASTIAMKYPALGGDLTRLLLPRVVELERQVNPAANGAEAWGWLPPPLVGEGAKVRPDWLHRFLLDPQPIRPALFMRMPQFNLSSEDATKLVDYFAARDHAEYPFESSVRNRHVDREAAEVAFAELTGGHSSRLGQAMKIVTNDSYCIKCHSVGDFEVAGSDRAKAPNLAHVYQRLRPGYARRWIANPRRVLPYTSMPVNIPFEGGISQSIYPGSSTQQLNALVDLLVNYDQYLAEQARIAPLVGGVEEASDGATTDAE